MIKTAVVAVNELKSKHGLRTQYTVDVTMTEREGTRVAHGTGLSTRSVTVANTEAHENMLDALTSYAGLVANGPGSARHKSLAHTHVHTRAHTHTLTITHTALQI
jgi:hypothetical protein